MLCIPYSEKEMQGEPTSLELHCIVLFNVKVVLKDIQNLWKNQDTQRLWSQGIWFKVLWIQWKGSHWSQWSSDQCLGPTMLECRFQSLMDYGKCQPACPWQDDIGEAAVFQAQHAVKTGGHSQPACWEKTTLCVWWPWNTVETGKQSNPKGPNQIRANQQLWLARV